MKELKSFPGCDGHIESIVIGYHCAKISFQTWNLKKLVLIYDEVENINEQSSVFRDIGQYIETKIDNGFTEYIFYDTDDNLILSLHAKSIKIFELGNVTDINSALFNVGYDYIGDQCFCYENRRFS